MPVVELSDDEFEILRDAFNDVGCDCPSVNWDKFKALGVKFGFWEAEKLPTEEELKRREEWINDEYLKLSKVFAQMDKDLAKKMIENYKFFDGVNWPRIGSLRIKLPNDYQVKDK